MGLYLWGARSALVSYRRDIRCAQRNDREVVIEAAEVAQKYGTVVSYDLNYRPSLWKGFGGLEKCREINSQIASYVDVMIGNEEDFTACLGLSVEGVDEQLTDLNPVRFQEMIAQLIETYPNLKAAATTMRGSRPLAEMIGVPPAGMRVPFIPPRIAPI